MTQTVRIALIGLGHVGRAFLDLMTDKAALLAGRHDLNLVLTATADSSGALLDGRGISPMALRQHKAGGDRVATFSGALPGLSSPEMVRRAEADIVLDASPVNLRDGQPGLDCVRVALARGLPVVLANKAPLVLAFSELAQAAAARGVGLAYSATVCGALPVVNIGQRDLAGCQVRAVAGIFNSTSNSILAAMARRESYADALRLAQLDGIAETDPSLDVEGWDTANKLVIIANSILGMPATLADVQPVKGITGITAEQIRAEATRGRTVKLIARADFVGRAEQIEGPIYRLSVQPEWLPAGDFLAGVNGWEMGIIFDTDIMGLQQFKVDERGPVPTAGAMLRDVIRLATHP